MNNVKKIFITGCAKSGTTLLFRLCKSFEADFTHGNEVNISDFIHLAKSSKSNFFIGKRGGRALFSVCHVKKYRYIKIIKNNDIKILNIIRDGRDVVLSDNNYVSPKTWFCCMRQSRKFRDYIYYEVKYEDLIRKPNRTQDRIAKKFGLTIKHKFSEYPNFVPDADFKLVENKLRNKILVNPNEKEQVTTYRKRPLSFMSIGKDKYKKAYIKLCKNTKDRLDFEKELRLAGYIK